MQYGCRSDVSLLSSQLSTFESFSCNIKVLLSEAESWGSKSSLVFFVQLSWYYKAVLQQRNLKVPGNLVIMSWLQSAHHSVSIGNQNNSKYPTHCALNSTFTHCLWCIFQVLSAVIYHSTKCAFSFVDSELGHFTAVVCSTCLGNGTAAPSVSGILDFWETALKHRSKVKTKQAPNFKPCMHNCTY